MICFIIDFKEIVCPYSKNTDFSSKYRINTDQSLGFSGKVCIEDQNYFYRPLCHHCSTIQDQKFLTEMQGGLSFDRVLGVLSYIFKYKKLYSLYEQLPRMAKILENPQK